MVGWWLGWAGCDGARDDGPSPDDAVTTPRHTGTTSTATPPTHTGGASGDTGVPVPGVDLRCQLAPDNALRVACRVTVDPPQPVELRWVKADGTGRERARRSDVAAPTHDLSLWYFAPDTDYTVTATADDGSGPVAVTLHTGTLPAYADVMITSQGTSSADLFLTTSPCTGAAAIAWDPNDREIVWYQRMWSQPGAFLEGVQHTDADTVLGLASGNVIEVDWAGTPVRTLRAGIDLPNPVHHDAFQRAGLTYVIFQEELTPGGTWADGFYVFDAVGLSWEWHLGDFVQPSGGPSDYGVDWSHGNAIWADAAGDVYASYRHLSGVVKVEGDPLDPAFGQIRWRLAGVPDSDLGSDFVLVDDGTGFQQQHNPHVLDDGTLTMFDNRRGLERSRILDWTLDEVAGTATRTRTWDVPGDVYGLAHCDFQGAAWRTAAGNPVATCAPFRHATEFDAVTGAEVWNGSLECSILGGAYVPRFVPIDE